MTLTLYGIRDLNPAEVARSIIADVAREHDVTREEILSRSNPMRIVTARHDAMHRVRQELGWSYERIGRLFNRDHSTVLAAVRKTKEGAA